MLSFSVCMSVYRNDKPDEVFMSINSVINQTVKPDEVVVVIDGPISSELESVISKFENERKIRTIPLNKNVGLGNALQIGVLETKNELIARMDSDDIALPDRFEKQLECFAEDKDLSIVGGSIMEFIDSPDNIISIRSCPATDQAIKSYMRWRCGLNHMTVMFKKSEVLKAGNYQDWHYNEDYYLWLRMMKQGCKFKNLEDPLVNVRVGRNMYARRGGLKYFRSEAALQKYMLNEGIIRFPRFCFNVVVRWAVQVMLPDRMRRFLFQKLFRKSKLRRNGSKV